MDISKYVLEPLRADGEFVLGRGRAPSPAPSSARSILTLAPAAEHPAPELLRRLEHEYSLRAELDAAWAVRPILLTRNQDRTTLILEDPGNEPLDRLLGKRIELGQFLRFAVGLSASLRQLHGRGLIHKDIKPANVLVNPATGHVWLMGFGIASRLPRERQPPEPPEFITGTLPYMAPEQTGRMNRSIDSRSDLYSFGVTLYEMLTGSLPFTAANPMEWVHCHIARQPVPPAERVKDTPGAVSAIVMKLLAKTAEERYQTAGGVEHDLRRCLAQWEAQGRIDDFPLGEHDTPAKLLIPEKLYGREYEIETLLAAFDHVVSSGTPELVLVSGYSGIGKSSVVNELHKVMAGSNGLFAVGKLDQYKRDIPYFTLAQAFQSLIRSLLSKSEAELRKWRDTLREALDPNGQLMVDLVPELKLVIGEQPPVPELPPRDQQARFQLVFRRLLGVFACSEHPLVLFLDDLQWLDAATLDLIEDLLTHPEVQRLMLIGAYRDNEVDSTHPLMHKLESLKKAGAKIVEISLAPLAREQLRQLIAHALRCDSQRAAALTKLVNEKTAGNPFFAIQFLYALAEEGLLTFNDEDAQWCWELERIHAKGYTDNVVDLIVGKLSRLPAPTQNALRQLACVGNIASIRTLSLVHGTSEEQVDADLWEAVRQELVVRLDGAYKFVHDRVQESAYSLIPEESRAQTHLRVGRLLAAHTPPEKREENIFDIVNQLNRGAALITSGEERDQLAELNLIAGKRAKTSTAYASANRYLSIGMDLLGNAGWDRRYELAFGLWLEAAECEYLNGRLENAERLVSELLVHARTKLDMAASYRLQILFHVTNSAYQAAIDCGLECLRLFGIAIPPHPAREQIEAEYEKFWASLAGRSVESLIDLPLAVDPERRGVAAIFAALFAPTVFTNSKLFYMLICRGANLTLDHGTSEATTHIYSGLAQILGPVFHRYEDGLRFGTLSYELHKKYGFGAMKAHFAMQNAAVWCRPIQTAIDHTRLGYRLAAESGDLSYACYLSFRLVAYLLLQGGPLDMVSSQFQEGIELARRIKFRDYVDLMACQQAFIANMRGETATFSSFDSSLFDEAAFEAGLTGGRMSVMVCWYWILKLQARFIFRDFATARVAARKAGAVVSASQPFIQWANYVFFGALSIAALHDERPDTRADELDELHEHLAQLREWADACPTTFLDKYTLVAAEMARLEGRELDAMRLYEQAIRAARANGFVHDEALANELAARFYAVRGFEKIAHAYLRDARYGYLRWGADGKVRQLDELYPHLRPEELAPAPTGTIGAPVERLDLATVIKISQAISGEIVLERLIETLMRTTLEHTGAQRGLLLLPQGAELRIEAEATTSVDTIVVHQQDSAITPTALPQSVLQYVVRTHESVILDDASAENPFSADTYVDQQHARSILCLPLLNQATLIGVLYLENNLAPRVFAPARITVLKLLASQAAIALENTRLYRDLSQREAKIRRLVDANIIGIFIWDFDGRIVEANDAFLRIVGYEREDLVAGRLCWTDLTPPEWRHRDVQRWIPEHKRTGRLPPFEKEYFRKDGSRVPVLMGVATFEEGGTQGVAFVLDLTERKLAEETLRETQAELAHVARVGTLGEMAASIAHEINQPLGAIANNAGASLRWLAGNNVEEAQRSVELIRGDAHRAGEIIQRIRSFAKKTHPQKDWIDINQTIREVIALARSEIQRNGVALEVQLPDDVQPAPLVFADRIQLQQVILNLIMNAVEAMSESSDGPRDLLIRTGTDASGAIVVAVRDSGPGLTPENLDRLFTPFYTTKPQGMGMGLAICRSIVEAHVGRLWATPNDDRGATFQFSLPAGGGVS